MLEIVEILSLMEKGTTEPIRCRLSDGRTAVVKYPGNICGTSTLINELIGNNIAKDIGVSVPDFGVCILPKEIIGSNSDIDILDERNAGVCYFSTYLSKAVPKVLWGLAKNRETERSIKFVIC